MRKKLALILSFMLLCYCFTPFAYAEEAGSQTSETTAESPSEAPETPSTKSDEKPSDAEESTEKSTEKPTQKPATKPAASSTVTSDTYLADQLSDLKGLSKDNKKKINVMLKMGAVEQEAADKFGADAVVTRAQLAKTAALVLGLTIDSKVKSSSFNDVKQNDPTVTYIEALKTAKLTYNTVDNKYDPEGAVTRQELAMLLIKGLGLDDKAKAAAAVKDDTVDDAYKSYVAYALQQKLMTNQTGGKFDGKVSVTKQMLALTAHEAWRLHTSTAKPAKASIAEVKVIGKNKLSVRLNRDVDSNKAVLNVTIAGILDSDNKPVKFEPNTTWSDDEMTAELEMTENFEFAQYQVILSGVDVEGGTMTFMPENERPAKVEFVTTAEKLPWSKALIEYKALNQYGEQMNLAASNMSIYVGAAKRVTSTILANSNAIILDLSELTPDSSVTVNLLERSGYLSIGKTFTVGDMPQVKKVDLGDTEKNLILPAGQTVFQSGGRAYLTFKAYDQYGLPIVDPKILNMSLLKTFTGALGNVFRIDGANDFIDFNNDGFPELQLVPYADLDSDKEVNVNLIFNGEQVSQKVKVISPKSPYSIVIGPVTEPLTEGDVNKEIGLKVLDSVNRELEGEEVADLESAGKITVYATGGLVLEGDPAIRNNVNVKLNPNGSIRIKQITAPGPATIYVRINGLDQTVSYPLMIDSARKPSTIKVDENNSAKTILLINSLSAGKTKASFKFFDQFDADYYTNSNDYKVEMKLERISGVTAAVYTSGPVALSEATPVALVNISSLADSNGGKGINLHPIVNQKGSYKLTGTLVHLDANGQIQERLSSDSLVIDVDDATNPSLTYALDIKSGDLLAIGRILYDSGKLDSVTNATYLFNNYAALAKDVNVLTKDALGLDTGLKVKIRAVTSSNPKAVAYKEIKDVGKLIGLDSGKFDFNVYFDTPNGVKSISQSLGTGVDSMVPSSLKAKNGSKTLDDTVNLNGWYLWETNLMGQLQVGTNDYGTFTNKCSVDTAPCPKESNQDQFTGINDQLAVQAFIGDIQYFSDVTDSALQDVITINPDFTLSYTRNGSATKNNIYKFTIYLVGGNTQIKTQVTIKKT